MKYLIITSGSGKNFYQLKNLIDSLQTNGKYTGEIAICDNAIEGTWNKPGTWSKLPSFSEEQNSYFKKNGVQVFTLQNLITENGLDEQVIKNIKSPTQRYPHKFIYNTLISKKYLGKVDKIIYFDSDVYFQAPTEPLWQQIEFGKIVIVKEWLKMNEGIFLNKWLKFSDFSKLSSQKDYEKTMLPADNFCSGMYGADSQTFHRFNLMALLLTSNQFINFFSDQPLVNILKTYFKYPFKEISFEYCLHLGELSRDNYLIGNGKFVVQNKVPISVHFNSNKYNELEAVINNSPLPTIKNRTVLNRIKDKLLFILKKLR